MEKLPPNLYAIIYFFILKDACSISFKIKWLMHVGTSMKILELAIDVGTLARA